MNAAAITREITALALHLERPVPDIAPLVELASLVDRWNAKMNLTGARTPAALVEVLFADALVLAGVVPPGARCLDVGAGAGAPSIPLVILRPDLRMRLLEPIHKRVAFMRTAIGTLDLADRVRVVEGRVDPEAPRVEGGPFDLALSRATFAPAEWARIGAALAPAFVVLGTGEEPPELAVGQRVERYVLPTGTARWLVVGAAPS